MNTAASNPWCPLRGHREQSAAVDRQYYHRVRDDRRRPQTASDPHCQRRIFRCHGTPLLAGRAFTAQDQSVDAPAVGVINQHLAREMFPGRDPLDQMFPVPNAKPMRIVGVVKDAAQMSYERPAENELYIPYRQYIFGVFMSTIVVRTAGDPLALTAALQKAIWGGGSQSTDRKGGNAERRNRGFHLAASLFGAGVHGIGRAGAAAHLGGRL